MVSFDALRAPQTIIALGSVLGEQTNLRSLLFPCHYMMALVQWVSASMTRVVMELIET
jgi:hypothetical protein